MTRWFLTRTLLVVLLIAGTPACRAVTLAEKYPQASAVFDTIGQYPLIQNALLDDDYLARLSRERTAEQELRKQLGVAAFRKFGGTRSVRVELLQGTTTEQPAVILEYQTQWKRFTSLPSGGQAQTDPVLIGVGRDSMWHRSFYGGTDDAGAHKEFEALLEERRKAPSNRRSSLDPQFVALAEKYLPKTPLTEVRADVKGTIERLVKAFQPYGAEIITNPQYGHYGAKITDHLYLYIRDFPENAPTRFDHDPFFWLIVSGGPKPIPHDLIPAFPGAEGMGSLATGGHGGKVIYVTNTNSTGPGSLKEALQTPGPRIVLFKVSGQINLPDETWITEPNLTLIGYTAPGEGVEVNGRLCLAADNVILRGMRFRLRPPTTKDGMSTRGRLHNVIFDHCSFAYASDELLRMIGGESSFYGFTIQYCLLGPGLAGLGDHPYGPEMGGYGTFHHNLFYNTLSRSPEVDCALIDWSYNIMANMRSGHSLRPHSRFNMVGNYIVDIPGNPNKYSFDANDSVYQADNLRERGKEVAGFRSHYQSSYLTGPYHVMPVTKDNPRELEKKLVPMAGAFLPARDVTDKYFLAKFTARQCKLPHLKGGKWRPYGNENDNMELYEMWEDKNFPPPAAGATAAADSDNDGMPDEWEKANQLNPNDASDGPADTDKDGYTNVEEWLNRTNPCEFIDYKDLKNNVDKVR